MRETAVRYLKFALAPRTISNYASAHKRFILFCQVYRLPTSPITEQLLIWFSVYLSLTISVKSIKGYISALRFWSVLQGNSFNVREMDLLYYTLRGIKRIQGDRFNKPKRKAITKEHLLLIHTRLQQLNLSVHDRRLYWAACTLAFFGLLRVSEYTTPKIHDFDRKFHLLLSDLQFEDESMSVRIKASKNDPFRAGCTIVIGASGDLLCPIAALKAYIQIRSCMPGPLFRFVDNSFLTRARFAAMLAKCVNNDLNINTHSFRIGGASALSAAGVSDAQIKLIGRWNSNCFIKYLRLSKPSVIDFASRMSRASNVKDFWAPPEDEGFISS